MSARCGANVAEPRPVAELNLLATGEVPVRLLPKGNNSRVLHLAPGDEGSVACAAVRFEAA